MPAKRRKLNAAEPQVQDSLNALKVPTMIDSSDLGIQILVNPPNPTVDVIAVHGLGATPSTTWTKQKPRESNKAQAESAGANQRDNAEEERINWLSHDTMLPAEVKNARVIAFNYDSNWYGPDAVKVRLDNIADEFIDTVERERRDCAKRPLILIGHCFGGLVIEKALIKRRADDIFYATTGVVLLGTPHRGTDQMTAGELVKRIILAGATNVEASSLTALRADNEMVFDTVQDFAFNARERKILIHCFFEMRASKVAKMLYDETLDYIVDEKSARIDGCSTHGLPLNHYQLNKFSNPEDGNWKRLCAVIFNLCTNAPTALNKRHIVGSCDPQTQSCLQDLRTTDPRDDKKRIEETKGGLLEDSYRWILKHPDFRKWRNNEQVRVLWIKGDPGKGKTMLLCGIIDEISAFTRLKNKEATTLLSYFFCQATDSRINNAMAVLRGLIYLLINQQPLLILHVQKKYDHAGKALFEDANAWVALCEIFTSILQDPGLNGTYLIVDALDECVTELPLLLALIVQTSSSSRVKWILSSRNRTDIERALRLDESRMRLSLELKENAEQISRAVAAYIDHCIFELPEMQYEVTMQDQVRNILRRKSSGTFLWVALVVRELKRVESWEVLDVVNEAPAGLEELYRRMMGQIQQLDRKKPELCRGVLSAATFTYRPLHLAELGILSGLPPNILSTYESVATVVNLCGSFLSIRDNIVYIIHQSAQDFLSAHKFIIPSGIKDVHQNIFSRSLQLMSKTLQRDVYSLRAPGISIDEVKQPDPDPLAAARYSCLYWVNHLLDCHTREDTTNDLKDGGLVYRFLYQSFLYWLEGLSLMKSVSDGIIMIRKLENWLQANQSPDLYAFIHDAKRFARYYQTLIEETPLQVYCSALVFAPDESIIGRKFGKCIPPWIQRKPKMQAFWNAALQTLKGHSGLVTSVAFSPDSEQVVSGSEDMTVRLWDTATGALLQTLEGNSDSVLSVVFSSDGKQVVSGSNDRIVRLWDTATGALLQTLEGHSDSVSSLAFSPDNKQIVSGSNKETLQLWDTPTGALLQTLKGHSNWIRSVAFSPDGKQVVSGSDDCTVRVWDIAIRVLLQTLEGHFESVRSVAFSPDGKQVASGSEDMTVRLWDTATGELLQTLEDHSDSVLSLAFSRDGKQVVSGSDDKTVRLWDTATGALLQTLEGHSNSVLSLAFSSDGKQVVSGSEDMTVRLWDIATGALLQPPEGHSEPVKSVAFSPDGKQVVSGSNDWTVRLWDTATGALLQTLEGHSEWVTSVAFSPDGKQVVSGFLDGIVQLWDAATGALLQTLEGTFASVTSVAFSPDGKQVVSGSDDKTVRLWDAATRALLQTLEGHSRWVTSVAFSPDGKQVVSGSEDMTVRLWDTATGVLLQTLEDHSDSVLSLAFSPDGKLLPTLQASDDWIVEGTSNILWLPPDYRPTCQAIWNRTVVLGHLSGRISFFQFKQGTNLVIQS